MKQHITPEQLDELTPEQKERLREQWEPKVGDFARLEHGKDIAFLLTNTDSRDYTKYFHTVATSKEQYIPLLSIGQMIELLNELDHELLCELLGDTILPGLKVDWGGTELEFCDALWEAVKHVL